MSEKLVYIYGLREPGNSMIEYVGKTNNPFVRLLGHIRDRNCCGSRRKVEWVRSLIENHCYPVMDIIEVCPESQIETREIFWIKYYKSVNPDLKNLKHMR